jgi:succinylglutamate-semialdehyde dehydrogenase
MEPVRGRGDLIDGAWVAGEAGADIVGHDPAKSFAVVWQGKGHESHVEPAVLAARRAQGPWFALSFAERLGHLERLQAAFDARVEEMATAIVHETGKPHREALGEARALGARVKLVAGAGMKRVETLVPDGVDGESRAHPQGVVAVIGPYNYPAHLVNAHVIPALLTGNTVVIKPTEHCPWTGEIYAQCVHDAGLPPGVINLVQGGGDVGRALVAHRGVDAILFTGSWETGRAITAACLDQPGKLVALEMGGKNCAVVLDDADLQQTLPYVLQGAFLTTGQRCTATSRVLVHRAIYDRFVEALAGAVRELRPGDPWDAQTAFGPLANGPAFERFCELRGHARAAGLEALVPGTTLEGGAFVTPSVHLLAPGQPDPVGYLDEELFGPDLCVEQIDDDDHAIARLNDSPYGLSNAVFTAHVERFERFFRETRSGLLNHNRSTNGASGQLPFGGVGKSGNQRPAGIDATRYATFPVAILRGGTGPAPVDATFGDAVAAGRAHLELDTDQLVARHRLEATLERYHLPIDDVRGGDVLVPVHRLRALDLRNAPFDPQLFVEACAPGVRLEEPWLVLSAPSAEEDGAFYEKLLPFLEELARENPIDLGGYPSQRVRRPAGGVLPRSDALLRRLYRGDFVPRERKTAVIEHNRTEGAYLRSVDDEPLVLLDAASQIASIGLGFQPGTYLRALDEGELGDALLANPDTSAPGEKSPDVERYTRFLCEHGWSKLQHATFASGGAEANERAFDLCRLNGPGGRRVIAFEGSFHGRTLAALHATSNPVKRKPFELHGYEATFVPFPRWWDPREEPPVPEGWVAAWSRGEAPPGSKGALLEAEIASLHAVKAAVTAGEVCCVIVEPFQGEGGDNFGTARFFQGLRALTRHLGVPLVFDEVQSGFGLGGTFYWHERFGLCDADNNPDGPDCVTLAKKAQLGVCLSVWEDPRPAPAHVLQAIRGHLHGQGIIESKPAELEPHVRERLWALAVDYPSLVKSPRNIGWSFAFDLPSKHLALQLVAQRFYRGFMAYVAGERTVRFRLNASWTAHELDELFGGVREALDAIRESAADAAPDDRLAAMERYTAPAWEDAPPAGKRRSRFAGEYERLAQDRPRLLAWLLSLPRGPLERVCDRVLYIENQLDEKLVDAAVRTLVDKEPGSARPGEILGALREISDELEAGDDPAGTYARWEETLGIGPARLCVETIGARLSRLHAEQWDEVRDDVWGIETATYEAGRRDELEELREMVQGEGGVSLVLRRRTEHGDNRVLGYAFGGPLESYESDGPAHDAMRERGNTFYSANITVDARARAAGLGLRLKREQVRLIASLTDERGRPRYHFMTGRNRVGRTREMAGINRAFGAYPVDHFRGNQYGDQSGEALYYRIPLRRPRVVTGVGDDDGRAAIDWASSVQAPLGRRPAAVRAALERGDFTGPVGTKLTLSNFITPEFVRYAELLRAVAPRGLAHAYFTSGQAELVDKGLRCLRVNRPKADVVIGLERQFVGTVSAAARSLTDPEGQVQPFGWYDWPRVPHPAEVGPEASMGAILAAIQKVGPERVLGVVVELVGEKSGLVVPDDFVEDLCALRQDTGVPVVVVETASALGRAGGHLFASDGLRAHPSMIWWYAGAQLGHIFCDDETYVAKPLTLISTWDGDEVSMLRTRHHLVAARGALGDGRADAFFDALVGTVGDRGVVSGRGLYATVDVGDAAARDALLAGAQTEGLRLGRGLGGRVVVAPPIDLDERARAEGLSRLDRALGDAAAEDR